MVVVRLVFQAKFGTANQVVAGFKQAMEVASQVLGKTPAAVFSPI